MSEVRRGCALNASMDLLCFKNSGNNLLKVSHLFFPLREKKISARRLEVPGWYGVANRSCACMDYKFAKQVAKAVADPRSSGAGEKRITPDPLISP